MDLEHAGHRRHRRDRGDPRRGCPRRASLVLSGSADPDDIAGRARPARRLPDEGADRRRARRARSSTPPTQVSATLRPCSPVFSRHPRAALGRARRADPDALRPRRRHRRHGLHADLAGRHAHRRAQPDAPDDRGRGALLREHGRCSSACSSSVRRCVHLAGLHHVTCVCSDAQRTTDFYRDALGFSLVKKTVNFDDPHSYHLYFGDEIGSPGTLITFFEWPRADRGPARARHARVDRARHADASAEERRPRIPTGCGSGSIPASGPACATSSRSATPISTPGSFADDAPLSFAEPVEETALIGAGHDPPRRVARRRRRRAARRGSSVSTSSGCGRRRAGPQVLPLGLLPDARRDPGRDRDRRRRASSSTSRARRSGTGLSLPPWLEPERDDARARARADRR